MYTHLMVKVYEAFGYQWKPIKLPNYLCFNITTQDDSQYVTVYSDIHKNKEITLGNSWSTEFTHEQIIKDVGCTILSRYGLKLADPRFE